MASADDEAVEAMMVIATCSLISRIRGKSAKYSMTFYRRKRRTERSWIHPSIQPSVKIMVEELL